MANHNVMSKLVLVAVINLISGTVVRVVSMDML